MSLHVLEQLANLIQHHRDELLANWRQQVRALPNARQLDTPTLNDHLPDYLDSVVDSLRKYLAGKPDDGTADRNSCAHGLQRVQDGFNIEEVVEEYGILRGCLHELAETHGIVLQGVSFKVINQILNDAISVAVANYSTRKALEVQQRREEYLAFVAHDLRTPLNAISLATRVLELVTSKLEISTETSQMVKTLRRNVQHLERLVGRVLDENVNMATEIGVKVERRWFDLWPLVEMLIHDLHPVAGTASIRLVNEIPEELQTFADASLIQRVFQNLLANAIKFTPRGCVWIGARDTQSDAGIECWVRDNGIGISRDRVDTVFEKFETDDPQNAGLGLGLAIVRTFIEAHGGKVLVESRVGEGSTFRFNLPSSGQRPDGVGTGVR